MRGVAAGLCTLAPWHRQQLDAVSWQCLWGFELAAHASMQVPPGDRGPGRRKARIAGRIAIGTPAPRLLCPQAALRVHVVAAVLAPAP